MKSQSIEELVQEILDDPGRNPYVDETKDPSGEETVGARAWSLGHKQALEKFIARYQSLPQEPQNPTQEVDYDG